MSIKASEAVLEIKRRLGDVNLPVPDEVDCMSYLNAALRAIWNYGIELESPRLELTETASVASGINDIVFSKGAVRIAGVYNCSNGDRINCISPRAGAQWLAREASHSPDGKDYCGYYETLDGISIVKTDACPALSLTISYFPEYTPISISSLLPFPDHLIDVAMAMTIKLIKEGASPLANNMTYLLDGPVTTLRQYFEARSEDSYVGRGAW